MIGLCSEKAVMKICALLSAGEWRNGDGTVDREAIEEFLTQAKRIYEAQMDGILQNCVERFRKTDEYYTQYVAEELEAESVRPRPGAIMWHLWRPR